MMTKHTSGGGARARRLTGPFLCVPFLLGIGLLSSALTGALFAQPDLGDVAVLATNSITLARGAEVEGDVVVNDASFSPTVELTLGRQAAIVGNAWADSIGLGRDASISGDASFNDLTKGRNATVGAEITPLSLPVFSSLPPFLSFQPRGGEADVIVGGGADEDSDEDSDSGGDSDSGSDSADSDSDGTTGETVVLAPGSFGVLSIGKDSTVVLTGGFYQFEAIVGDQGARILYEGPVEIRVDGGIEMDQRCEIGPATLPGTGPADVLFYIGGAAGASFDKACVVAANLYAIGGPVELGRDAAFFGSILAPDVEIGRDATVELASAFGNRPPVAFPQTATTTGATPLSLVLEGSDPEGGDLTFSIVTPPAEGTLSALVPIVPPPGTDPVTGDPVQPPITSAAVTYTPTTAADLEDSFVFQVTDPGGLTGMATVSINPVDPSPPPDTPVTTVSAFDTTAETAVELAVTVELLAEAPCDGPCDGAGAAPNTDDVPLTFSIFSPPSSGALSALTQGTGVPQRTASVVYTPNAGFAGSDSFVFEACGTIGGALTCATATATVTVSGELAGDTTVNTDQATTVTIELPASPGAGSGGSAAAPTRTQVRGRVVPDRSDARRTVSRRGETPRSRQAAAFLDGAEIAGNAADADGDGFGDNVNALPGPAPVLAAAGVGLSGGPGSNGTVRIQIEWDLTDLKVLANDLESAQVVLTTNKGTIDSLVTSWFLAAGDEDGLLTNDDFETPIAGFTDPQTGQFFPTILAGMPVPADPVGTEGTFSFDVTSQLQEALQNDSQRFFTIQGRVVNEAVAGPARGLQVYTTADNSLLQNKQPQLSLTTPGLAVPQIRFEIVSLPASGALFDTFGNAIVSVPFVTSNKVIYQPDGVFTGTVQFGFRVTDFTTGVVDTGIVTVIVDPFECVEVGREPGCQPGS